MNASTPMFQRSAWMFLLLAALWVAPGANAAPYNDNYRFFVPRAQEGATSVIDGSIAPAGAFESMWNNAAKFDLDLGASIPAASMWVVRDAGHVYMYFEIEADDFYIKDVLVLALGSAAGGSYQRLHIFPCGALQGNCPSSAVLGHSPKVEYWTATAHPFNWSTANVPTGFDAKSAFAVATGTAKDRWSVEVKLPIAGFSLPATGFFGLYVDIADVTNATGDAWQYPWPPKTAAPTTSAPSPGANIIGGVPASIVSQIQSGTPAPDRWGQATLATSQNGVQITDVYTNHSQSPTLLSTIGPNRINARVRNNTSTAGQLVDAHSVRAEFKISGWGTGGPWTTVPPSGSPLSPYPNPTSYETVPATGSFLYAIGDWNMTQGEKNNYAAPNDHQCVLVQLSSTGGASFFNPQYQQNMDFVQTASPFLRSAKIGGSDLDWSGKQPVEVVLREIFLNTDPRGKWQSKLGVARQRDQYTVPLRRKDEVVGVDLAVEPPEMRIPRKVLTISPRATRPQEIPVQAGEIITLFAEGQMALRTRHGDKTLSDPSGRDFTRDAALFEAIYHDVRRSEGRGKRPFLLDRRDLPQTQVGALVGSWDGFRKSSFAVGQAITVKVPKGARSLSLAVNDLPNAAPLRGGKGYRVTVVQTPMQPYYGTSNAIARRDATMDSFILPLGSNLPTWIARAGARTGKVIVIDGETFQALEPMSSFGAIVNKMGP